MALWLRTQLIFISKKMIQCAFNNFFGNLVLRFFLVLLPDLWQPGARQRLQKWFPGADFQAWLSWGTGIGDHWAGWFINHQWGVVPSMAVSQNGWFIWGNPPLLKWMVFVGENPIKIRMMTGGTPILANPHMAIFWEGKSEKRHFGVSSFERHPNWRPDLYWKVRSHSCFNVSPLGFKQ